MDLLTPSFGTLIWTSIVFLLLVFLLTKFAWKPILSAINARETEITDTLNQAKLARTEIAELKADNEKIIREAKLERDAILKEAREIKERIIAEAKDAATLQGDQMIAQAKQAIDAEKIAAMADVKKQIGLLSVDIAEHILKQKLDQPSAQEELVTRVLSKNNLN